ncbi:hypothetical protein EDD21DRAFT_745 [Dissophora ornata]|nr:hypothetical protein EDD21DRAFT_745 [Dissophora ornata]
MVALDLHIIFCISFTPGMQKTAPEDVPPSLKIMDAPTARTVAASLAVITAVLLARSLSSPSDIDTKSEKRKGNKAKSKGRNTRNVEVPQYVAGLVNVGNTCFMNAVLQALASLPSLRAYLEARKDIGHAQDSITLALCETIEMLNIIHQHPTAKRLIRMVSTVKAKAAHVLTSQQQVRSVIRSEGSRIFWAQYISHYDEPNDSHVFLF